MGKRVFIIASGETERLALPHLLRHLEPEGVTVLEVRKRSHSFSLFEQAVRNGALSK